MFNIIGIDPGTNHIGVSVLTIDDKKFNIKKIITFEVNISNIESEHILNNNLHYRLSSVSNVVYSIMNFYNPVAVGMESPFMNPSRPASALPLGQSVQAIKYGIYMYNKYLPIGMYPPSTVKNTVGAKGGADKIEILDAVLKLKYITRLINVNTITDHEVDAIAIALSALEDIRYNPCILL